MAFTQGSFPPVAPSVLGKIIPAYAYVQYNDDDAIQAFFSSYNDAQQYYLGWFVNAGLPVYTGLSGSLLDWVAQGLYGLRRPVLEAVGSNIQGPYNSVVYNRDNYPYNASSPAVPSTFSTATDDIFQRILTWHLYRGDGRAFTLKWLKRRVLRFLKGANGIDVNVADTSQVSIGISGDTVTINVSAVTGVAPSIIAALLEAVQGSVLELPPQFLFQVIT